MLGFEENEVKTMSERQQVLQQGPIVRGGTQKLKKRRKEKKMFIELLFLLDPASLRETHSLVKII